jgi:hypothetical protein
MVNEPIEYSIEYWKENFVRDVEAFGKFWSIERESRPQEFPELMTLGDWDEQFINWLNRTSTRIP